MIYFRLRGLGITANADILPSGAPVQERHFAFTQRQEQEQGRLGRANQGEDAELITQDTSGKVIPSPVVEDAIVDHVRRFAEALPRGAPAVGD